MSGNEFDGIALVDLARSVCLCDVGAAGYVVALCVTAAGEDVAWLVNEAELLNGENAEHGHSDQPHERLGPLPAAIRERVSPAPRCGRPTHAGTPCRQRVKATGQACGQHSARAAP